MKRANHLLSILEVSEKLNIPTHTLRFWEKELNGLFTPLRTNGRQRRYTLENLLLLEEIKNGRQNGLSLAEINEKFGQRFGGEASQSTKIDLLANRVAEAVKTEVYNFLKTETEKG